MTGIREVEEEVIGRVVEEKVIGRVVEEEAVHVLVIDIDVIVFELRDCFSIRALACRFIISFFLLSQK